MKKFRPEDQQAISGIEVFTDFTGIGSAFSPAKRHLK
jgi:hypothetical protein